MLETLRRWLGMGPKKEAGAPSEGAVAPPLAHGEAAHKDTRTPPLSHGEAAYKIQPAQEPPLTHGESAFKAPNVKPPLAEEEGEK